MAHLRTVTGLRLFARFITSSHARPQNIDILQHPAKVWISSRSLCSDFQRYLPVCTVSVPQTSMLCVRYSTDTGKHDNQPGTERATDTTSDKDPEVEKEEDEKQLSMFQRFKKSYKEHGKILIAVHVATSLVWFGSFYAAVHFGFDIIHILEQIGISERIIKPFRSSSLGDVALAYLLYKLVTPVRYMVSIGGTNATIKYLRKIGKMKPQQEKFRDLVKESKAGFKQEMVERKGALKDKQTEILTKVKNHQPLNRNKQKQNSADHNKDGQ